MENEIIFSVNKRNRFYKDVYWEWYTKEQQEKKLWRL